MSFRQSQKILELRRQMTQNSNSVDLAARGKIKIICCETICVCSCSQHPLPNHAPDKLANNCVVSLPSPTILFSCRNSMSNVNISFSDIHANFLENLWTKARFFSRFFLVQLWNPDYFQVVLVAIRCCIVDSLCNSFYLSCQFILYMGFRATLNFRTFKVALNPMYRIFLNIAKSFVLSCLSNVGNIKKIHCAVFEL